MEIRKEAGVDASPGLEPGDLERINGLSRKRLTEEEVYAFSIRLCDNEVDRDGERFSGGALEDLAQRFVGKSGVFDHQWSARGQAARIYRTEVVDQPGQKTRAGEGYRYLKGWAYMLRTEGNRDLIAEIEGGIKKEVSVGCAVEKAACSICGADTRSGEGCRHVKGRTYGGKLCWTELDGVTDAYEWSFVAVPAQPRAGVLKGFREEAGGLRKALAGQRERLEELERLEAEAGLGRRYLKGLREEAVRLGGLAEAGMDAEILAGIAEKLEEDELLALIKSCRQRVSARFPVGVQLTYRGEDRPEAGRDGAYLI